MIAHLKVGEGTTVALIEIGSDAMRLTVAQILKAGEWKVLDRAHNPLKLGHDVFSSGVIMRDTLYRLLTILGGYLELLDGLGVARENVLISATTAFREARNYLTIADRVQVKTGLTVHLIEGVEATHLTYTAVEHSLKPIWTKCFSRSNAFVVEIGGASTELLMLSRGKIASAHTLRVGSVRFQEQFLNLRTQSNLDRMLGEQLTHMIESLDEEIDLAPIRTFVAVGSDMRIAARVIGTAVSPRHSTISKTDLEDFIHSLKRMRPEDIVHKYQIPWHDAESLLPSLLICRNFIEATSAERLIVPQATLRDGIFLRISRSRSRQKENSLFAQVRASAIGLARKYHCQDDHSKHVSHLALRLFDQLLDEHGLGEQHRLMLEVAALVHEVGKFIGHSAYHKHAEYIINNSQLFGLTPDEHRIVGSIVRYQRRALPLPAHPNFNILPKESKLSVMKLAAILRIVVSLERGHGQKVEDLEVKIEEGDLLLTALCRSDMSLERTSLEKEKNLFEEVYGLKVRLLDRRPRTGVEEIA